MYLNHCAAHLKLTHCKPTIYFNFFKTELIFSETAAI